MHPSSILRTAALTVVLLPGVAQAADAITVTGAVSRATPAGAPTGVGYMTITNDGGDADRLVSASSPAVDHVEIHEMAVKDGIMTMRPVPGGLPVPPHGSVVLKSGGYHLMMIHPKQPFKAGDVIPVTLTFEKAGAERIDLSVLPLGEVSYGIRVIGSVSDWSPFQRTPVTSTGRANQPDLVSPPSAR